MSRPMSSMERNLRRTAQMRALYYRLPHAALARERENLEEFEAFVAGRRSDCSGEAALDGCRRAWRTGALEAITTAAGRLPPVCTELEPLLWTYFEVARRALEARSRSG